MRLPLYARVCLTAPVATDEGTELPAGAEGTVVCHLSPTVCLVEFALPDTRWVGGCRFETAPVAEGSMRASEAPERRKVPRRGARATASPRGSSHPSHTQRLP